MVDKYFNISLECNFCLSSDRLSGRNDVTSDKFNFRLDIR